jgi:DNA-directed RNA polymerase subunit RPC12/RpoP
MCKEIREKFQELYSLNVNEYVEKKNDLSYLSWSYAWAEFKKIYPDATYEIKKDDQGRCYFGDENIGYMVYTSVSAGGLTYEMWLPVMDGANKAMKALAYTYKVADWQWDSVARKRVKVGDIEKTVEAMTMFDVNKTVMRCLVKNLAMFGLGLYIYAGEDLPQDIKEYVCADCGKQVDSAMAQRTHKAYGVHLCMECGLKRHKAQVEAKAKEGETNGS